MRNGTGLAHAIGHDRCSKEAPPRIKDGYLDHISLNNRVTGLSSKKFRGSLSKEPLHHVTLGLKVNPAARRLGHFGILSQDFQNLLTHRNQDVLAGELPLIGIGLDPRERGAAAGKEGAGGKKSQRQ